MSEQNKQIVRKFFEAMDNRRWDELRNLTHPDHVFRFPLAPEPLGRDAHIEMTKNFQMSFSEFDHIIEDQIAEGNKVVTRGKVRLKHTGEFNGIPPTNKTIEMGFINIVRKEDGKNREEWDEVNALHLMSELGAQ